MNFSFKILLALAFMVTTAQAQAQPKQSWHQTAWNQASNFVGTLTTYGFVATYPSSDDTTKTCMASVDHVQMAHIYTKFITNDCVSGDGMVCVTQAQYDEYLKQQGQNEIKDEIKDEVTNALEKYFDGKEFGAKYFKIVTPKELFFISAASIAAFLHSFYYMRMCKRALKDAQDTATVMIPVVHLQLITNLQHIMQDGLAWIVPEFDKSWNPFTWFSSTVWLMQAVSTLVIALVFVFVVLFLFKKHACKIFSFVGLFLFLVLEPESWAEINGFSALGFVLSLFWIWACRLLCLTNWTKDMDEYWCLVREDIIAKHLPRFPGEATEESQDFSKYVFLSDEESGQRYAIKRD